MTAASVRKGKNGDGNMIYSPDGKHFTFDYLSREGSDSDIYSLSIDGRTEVPLVEHPAHDCLLGWTPDGKHVLFSSDRTGTFDVWSLPISDGRPNGEPQMVRKNLGYVDRGFSFWKTEYYYDKSSVPNIHIMSILPL